MVARPDRPSSQPAFRSGDIREFFCKKTRAVAKPGQQGTKVTKHHFTFAEDSGGRGGMKRKASKEEEDEGSPGRVATTTTRQVPTTTDMEPTSKTTPPRDKPEDFDGRKEDFLGTLYVH